MASSDSLSLGELFYEVALRHLAVCYPNAAGTDLTIRCPYCGDSDKSTRKGHFYVSLLDEPLRFYCQRCTVSGVVTATTLRDLNLPDDSLLIRVYKSCKEAKYYRKLKTRETGFADKQLVVPYPLGTARELENLAYINERLGSDITLAEAAETYRVLLSFSAFFKANKISVHTEDPDRLRLYDKACVGFLSYDQSHVGFRSLNERSTGFRYRTYNIFGEYEDASRFYTIKSEVDVLKQRQHVVLAEGFFDIVGVHQHVYGGETNGSIFVAINGKGYNVVLLHLLRLGFLEMDVDIYSDDELELGFYKNMLSREPKLAAQNYRIHYNRKSKDFGVPADSIAVRSATLRIERNIRR
jgi:hypothetical protein